VSAHEIVVRVTPRAHLDEIVGERDGVVLVRVRAPPVDDRANTAVCRVIAKRLGVRPNNIRVVRGARSREKILRVDGVTAADLVRAFR
jgi:uncharacterized protein